MCEISQPKAVCHSQYKGVELGIGKTQLKTIRENEEQK